MTAIFPVLLAGCGAADPRPGEVKMRFEETTSRAGQNERLDYWAEGSVNLANDAGRATVHFPGGEDIGIPEIEIEWTADTVSAMGRTMTREDAAMFGGVTGTIPQLIHVLVRLPASAQPSRHRAFQVSVTDLLKRGIPTFGTQSETADVETQTDPSGRLRRVTLRIPRKGGRAKSGNTYPPSVSRRTLTLHG